MKHLTRVVFLLVIFSVIAGAQTFSVQGVLRDPLGRTVEDGAYALEFNMYEYPLGGTAVWTESHGTVNITHGVFNVELGSENALTDVPFDAQYWIGVTVVGSGEAEMTPRFKVSRVPAAMSVFGTENIFPSIGNIGAGTTTPEAALHIVVSDGITDHLKIDDSSGDSKFIINADNNVGVGVATPEASLHIVAADGVTDHFKIDDNSGDPKFIVNADNNVGVGVATPEAALHIRPADDVEDKLRIQSSDGTDLVTITGDGKLGIGATVPAQALDIDGNIKVRNGGIMFDDGSTLTSAVMGGAASSLSNYGTTLIVGDADEDGTGNIDLIIGSTTQMQVKSTGVHATDINATNVNATNVNATNSYADKFYSTGDTEYFVDPANYSKMSSIRIGNATGYNDWGNAVGFDVSGNLQATYIYTHSIRPYLQGNYELKLSETSKLYRLVLGQEGASTATGYGDLYVYDDLEVGGVAYSTAWYTTSDRRLKKNIEPVGLHTLDKVMQLQPKKYHMKTQADSDKKKIGFIAQDLLPLFPEVVNTEYDTLSVEYSGFGVIAIAAIQELKQEKDALEERVIALEAIVRKLTADQ